MLKDFWKKAQNYLNKNKDLAEEPKPFVYNNSELEFELILKIVHMKDNLDYYLEAYEREYDYCTLLRKENIELNAYISALENDSSESDKKICIDISNDPMVS